ncbi:MAG: type III-B CRISPR module-associated Cmr3 family protein [Porticoccaceae bacterium]
MSIEYRFIEPLDVLFLRGNKLFGDPGSYGESLIPPWPSVAAGAIRSRMLVDRRIDLAAFAAGQITHDAELGTPKEPGSFTLSGFYLARKSDAGKAEVLLPPPADLVISKTDDGKLEVCRLSPQTINLPSSFPLPMLPVLAQGAKRSKPESGYWLTQAGWAVYVKGETPSTEQLVHASQLWSFDARVGIGMNGVTRSVEEGKLFSTQALVMHKKGSRIGTDKQTGEPIITNYDVGFLAAVTGAQPPADGLLRFGGDGRAASIETIDIALPEPDYQAIANAGRCRLVLTSPGLFVEGWKLPSRDGASQKNSDGHITLPGGITAKLVSAAIPRAETLSGWDLANWQPKPAQRVAPAGSVYWLEELEATPDALRNLVNSGLWGESCENDARRAEGFNRCIIGAWS